MSLEERLEVLSKQMQEMSVSNQELKAQNEYLRKQLGSHMKQKQKLQEPSIRIGMDYGHEEEASNALSFSEEDVPFKRTQRRTRSTFNSNEFKVEIPEFEGKLDPDEFTEWLQIGERIFDFEEILEDKKVKIVALRLRKYASL